VHRAAVLHVPDALAAFDPLELAAGQPKQSANTSMRSLAFCIQPIQPVSCCGLIATSRVTIEAKQAMAAEDQHRAVRGAAHAARRLVANLGDRAAPEAKQASLGGHQKRMIIACGKKAEDDLAGLAQVRNAEQPVAPRRKRLS